MSNRERGHHSLGMLKQETMGMETRVKQEEEVDTRIIVEDDKEI